MNTMHVLIKQNDSRFFVEIDGTPIHNVTDYKITSSASGSTELVIKLDVTAEITEFEIEATT